jgi:deoxycytidylate deaminase
VLQRVYVTMFPCNECAKLLIQAGIREVVYHEVSQGRRGGVCLQGVHNGRAAPGVSRIIP